MTLDEKLKNLPTAPGVYIHKNADGKIIYVGKAKNLKQSRALVFSIVAQSRRENARTRQTHRRFWIYRRWQRSRSACFGIESHQKTQAALQYSAQRRQTISASENDERAVSESRHHPKNRPRRRKLLRTFFARELWRAERWIWSIALFSCAPATSKLTENCRVRVSNIIWNAVSRRASKSFANPTNTRKPRAM